MLTANQLAFLVLYSPGFLVLIIKLGVYPPINIVKMISAGVPGNPSPGWFCNLSSG